MRARSPHHSDVFSHLPVALMRELDTEPVASLVEQLLAAGWRTGQLRHRVGAEPAQGSPDRDAAHLIVLLERLSDQTPPDVAYAQEREQRERQRAWQSEQATPAAAPEVRERALAAIRADLKGLPRRRRDPEPRTRPDCSLCGGEGAYFVTHQVHLCDRCVSVMATGEARLSSTG